MNSAHTTPSMIPFAVRNRELIDVTQLTSNEVGLKCNCRCSKCGKQLVARLAGRKRRKHFAHRANVDADTNCAGALETSVHEMAKQIVQRTRRLMLPDSGEIFSLRSHHAADQFVDWPSDTWLFPAKLAEFTSVVAERNVVFPTAQVLRPDLICNDTLYVEFFVSNKVGEEKRAALELAGKPCVEITLDPFIRDWLGGDRQADLTSSDTEQLTSFLLSSTEHREWIFDPRIDQWLESHRKPKYASIEGKQLALMDDKETRYEPSMYRW